MLQLVVRVSSDDPGNVCFLTVGSFADTAAGIVDGVGAAVVMSWFLQWPSALVRSARTFVVARCCGVLD